MMLEKKFNVVIIESDILTRITLKKMVEALNKFVVVADFDNAEDAISYIDDNSIDLVIIDIRLPYLSGIEASKLIKKRYPSIKVIALTSFGSDCYVISTLLADADAYYIRDFSMFELSSIINMVLNGFCDIDKRIQSALFSYIQSLPKEDYSIFWNNLSISESEFICLGLKGFTKMEISKFLGASMNELCLYIHSILNKLITFCKCDCLLREIEYDLF